MNTLNMCPKCGSHMVFEIDYNVGLPIVYEKCEHCGYSNKEQYVEYTNKSTYKDIIKRGF